jgi:hypothetical protein
MENAIFTLQDFMTHSKGVTYLVMGATLIVFVLFWNFLTGRDEKKKTY